METIEELQAFLEEATRDGVWGQLLDRGTAWAIMRKAGHLPEEAPPLGATIETDLSEYGFSVLRAALALREVGGSRQISQRAFEKAAEAFESLVRNGPPDAEDRGFYRTIAGAAHHLAGYSAIAYSLFSQQTVGLNSTPGEEALMLLILRDLDGLRDKTREWLLNDANSDQAIASSLADEEFDTDDAVAVIINSTICRALAYFDFALQTGEPSLTGTALELLSVAVDLAADAGAVSLWWITRLCFNLIGDLWEHSLHMNLPAEAPEGGDQDYGAMRQLFLTTLYGRKSSEVELWPSQREAARRSSNVSDDLVVALPTSAGKTRIAEIATLMTLSTGKRVLIVTPLRALSAQTERTYRKTFSPLGFTVSSLYGASGTSSGDEDALRSKDIVIATPEKLDFALRSDSSLINDVGLIVLDEGHLIGPTDREIRYEILVQRLLHRADAVERRIICLSAILPEGQQLDDLTAWIRSDVEGESVKSDWRPTRQRFGTLMWQGKAAKLSFDLNDDGPFLARFVEEVPPRGQQKLPFPRETKDLSIFAAWNLALQGKRTLLFITQANWVEGYGKIATELFKRGYLPTLLDSPDSIERALEVGREWLGDRHPAVEALKIGVAIHHGRLPNPFLRELEALLAEGVLKVTVASPTLSQGLNLNASVLLVPSLHRSGKPITGEEFANVTGRAGRAFVDVEGLVVHVMHKGDEWRLGMWRELVASVKSRDLKSGLIQIVDKIISLLSQQGVLARDDAFEYLANSHEAWNSLAEGSDTEDDDQDDDHDAEEPLSHLVEKLDTAVLGLIEALDADSPDLPRLLDEALQGSLWKRQIEREDEDVQNEHKAILEARAHLIWDNTTPAARKGHFAMGVGLDTGLAMDAMAEDLTTLIDRADRAALEGDETELAESLIGLGKILLVLKPFVPDKRNALPPDWESILTMWVTGVDVNAIGPDNVHVIEDAFTYRLVWALEAVRVRRIALGWTPDSVAGGAAASLETGVPQFMMSMLIRAGLPSRKAAIAAIRKSGALFVDGMGMRNWLESEEIGLLTDADDWPTPETAELWKHFRADILGSGIQQWRIQRNSYAIDLSGGKARPPDGVYRVEIDKPQGDVWVCTPDYKRLVRAKVHVKDPKPSFFAAYFVDGSSRVQFWRIGRGQAKWVKNAS